MKYKGKISINTNNTSIVQAILFAIQYTQTFTIANKQKHNLLPNNPVVVDYAPACEVSGERHINTDFASIVSVIQITIAIYKSVGK